MGQDAESVTAVLDSDSQLPEYDSLLATDIPPGESSLAEILRLSREVQFSFAGGLPDPATFPDIVSLTQRAKERERQGQSDLQYGLSSGSVDLSRAAMPWLQRMTVDVRKPEDILITTGSQSALSLVGRVFVQHPGEIVAVESPTYLGLLDALEGRPTYKIIDSDENGMKPKSLYQVLRDYPVKFAYADPEFQNPSGTTIPLGRRKDIADILKERRAILVEDTPYRELRYDGEHIPTIHSLAPDNVIFMTTLSKVLAPGLRIGLTVAPARVRELMTTVNGWRQLCPSTLDQAIAAVYFADGDIERHIPEIVAHYRPRRKAMNDALTKYFPDGWQWVMPQGGMFFWPWGPEGTDTREIFPRALARGVAFVPGDLFHPELGVSSAMRLNFSLANEQKIRDGIRILGEVIRESPRM